MTIRIFFYRYLLGIISKSGTVRHDRKLRKVHQKVGFKTASYKHQDCLQRINKLLLKIYCSRFQLSILKTIMFTAGFGPKQDFLKHLVLLALIHKIKLHGPSADLKFLIFNSFCIKMSKKSNSQTFLKPLKNSWQS